MSEEKAISAEPFSARKPFTEVHSHKRYRYLQGGVYYDHQGNPVAEQPKPPTIRKGARVLRTGKHSDTAAALALPSQTTVIGKVPDRVAKARKENAKAKAAEDLLG